MFIVACIFTVILVFLLRPLAFRFDLLDHPGGRRSHRTPAQLTGGLAIFLSLMFVVLIDYPLLPTGLSNFIPAFFSILLIGLIDDCMELRYSLAILLQFIVALFVIFLSHLGVDHIGSLFGLGDIHTSYLKVPFTLISIVGVINAFNMIDGKDGLAGSLALVSLGWFALLGVLVNDYLVVFTSQILIAALIGFLLFNLRTALHSNAQVFLGSAGSMTLGLLMAWLSIKLSGNLTSKVSPITCVWIIGIPLMDMARVMLVRVKKELSPFTADRTHLHHLLDDIGYSSGQVLFIIVSASVLMGGVGVLAWVMHVPDFVMFSFFIFLLAIYVFGLGPRMESALDAIKLQS